MANMPRHSSVDDAIKNMAAEQVEQAAYERESRQPEEESPLGETDQGPISEEETIADIFSHVPADEGYYLKIYRRTPVPKEFGSRPMFLLDVPQPETIQDLESELLKFAKANSWCDGLYEIKLFRQGKPGVVAARRIALSVPSVTTTSPNGGGHGVDPYAQLLQTARLLKELNGNAPQGTSNADPEKILKTVADAYKLGGDAVKAAAPAPSTDKPVSLVEIIKAIKELAPAPTPPQNPIALLTLFKELGLLKGAEKTEDDFLTKLTALKAAGLLGGVQQDPQEQFNRMLEMMTGIMALTKNFGGGGDGPVSLGTEIVRLLAPQASKIIGDVTGSLNKMVEAKTKLPIRSPRLEPNPVPPTTTLAPITETPMLPILRPVKDAINRRDTSFFPELRILIQKYAGDQVYEDILDRKYSVDELCAYIASFGGAYFSTPEVKQYFNDFLIWAKQEKSQEVVAFCPKCKEEIIFDSKEHFMSERNCPICSTSLTLEGSQDQTHEPEKSPVEEESVQNGGEELENSPLDEKAREGLIPGEEVQ